MTMATFRTTTHILNYASNVHSALPTLKKTFSSSPTPFTSKLSPLNKTTLLRAERAARLSGDQQKLQQRSGKKEKAKLTLEEAAVLLKDLSPKTPNAAYEINISLKPSPLIQLNALRGRVFLPHPSTPSTKSSLLICLTSPQSIPLALSSGANRAGGEELIEEILKGDLVPDKLVATKDMMSLFGKNPQLARILGPRGLMPSEKRGTVGSDVERLVKEARGGLDWKGDGKGVVRAAIGRLSFTPTALSENVNTLLASVSDIALGGSGQIKGIPQKTKRPAITRVLLSSTQGPGIELADV